MAKRDEVNGNAATSETPSDAPTESKSRFTKIETESYMFNAEKTYDALPPKDKLPLIGYLVGMQAMPPIKGRAWEAAVILTTEPVHALDREKNVVKLPPGSRVLIPATFAIVQHFSKAASNRDYVYEVSIAPNKKVDIGGGQTMWTYKLGANPKALARKAFGVAALLDSSVNAPALPQASEDDIVAPF